MGGKFYRYGNYSLIPPYLTFVLKSIKINFMLTGMVGYGLLQVAQVSCYQMNAFPSPIGYTRGEEIIVPAAIETVLKKKNLVFMYTLKWLCFNICYLLAEANC